MTKKRIVHYINQFYAGIGGEEMAGEVKPEAREGVVGPGAALQAALGDAAEVVGTVICGDGYYAEHMESANEEIVKLIAGFQPDAVVTGPAFNAGRYGTAAGGVADAVQKKLGIPAVSGMYNREPGRRYVQEVGIHRTDRRQRARHGQGHPRYGEARP